MRHKPHDEREFTVTGTWPFPYDMLRYDHCYPATEEESSKLEDLATRTMDAGRIAVKLRTRSQSGPTPGRWESFRWAVAPDSNRYL